MEKLAHITEDKREQTLSEHLENVSSLAEKFALPPFKALAKTAGAAHDIGKNAQTFQDRLRGSSEKFDHSTCGAIEIHNMDGDRTSAVIKPLLEYCIAGHHTGLPDGGTNGDPSDDSPTLNARLRRTDNYKGKNDYHGDEDYMKLSLPDVTEFIEVLNLKDTKGLFEKYAFFTRYIFSCLTDADFLDTEMFCTGNSERDLRGDTDKMYSAVSGILEKLNCNAQTLLQKSRAKIQKQALDNLDPSTDISIVNMPTGSGKTLLSLMLALELMKRSGGKIKRIIYVIPYTSIIEQTARLFSDIIGEYADIVQHHSNYIYDDSDENDLTAAKLKKACENWDAPVVITTSVQFFESIYHYKSSRLRKLHNIAQSVVVFDEIHLLPVELLQPCLKGVGYITKYLGSKAVFLSATMPNYRTLFERYIPECSITELITNKSDFKYFDKCGFNYLGEQTFESVAEKADKYNSSLIVVNSRKSARELYNILNGNKYHLSTFMTPQDRTDTIKRIRGDLEGGRQVCVVSTSLIEAGVDLDFEAVFRQLAGLDSILQAGGRCNREGKRPKGDVYCFSTQDKLQGDLALRANITRQLINEYESISSNECIEEYYTRLFDFRSKVIEKNSIAEGVSDIRAIPFRTYAQSFEFIKDETIGIVIDNCGETAELLMKAAGNDKVAKRKLQGFSVSLKHREFAEMLETGRVHLHESGMYVLTGKDDYSSETGLLLDRTNDIII